MFEVSSPRHLCRSTQTEGFKGQDDPNRAAIRGQHRSWGVHSTRNLHACRDDRYGIDCCRVCARLSLLQAAVRFVDQCSGNLRQLALQFQTNCSERPAAETTPWSNGRRPCLLRMSRKLFKTLSVCRSVTEQKQESLGRVGGAWSKLGRLLCTDDIP